MQIRVEGLEEVKKTLGEFSKKFPMAVNKAIQDTAFEARTAVRQEMGRVFDRPTPWALGTVRVDYKKKMTAVVGFTSTNSNASSNWRTPHFIEPQVLGGSRTYKRAERILRNAGVLPQDMYIAPARSAWLNQYGNVPGQEIEQILRSVGAFGGRSQLMSRSGKLRTKKQNRYFVMRQAGGRPIGISEVIWGARNHRPVLIFVKKPDYKPRLNFFTVAQNVVFARFKKNLKARVKEYSGYSL